MYINMVKFLGASWKNLGVFFFNFLKILMVSDKMIHKAFRIHNTIRGILYFHYLPKLYIGFKGHPRPTYKHIGSHGFL